MRSGELPKSKKIFPFFFIEEYYSRSTFFVIDIQFLKCCKLDNPYYHIEYKGSTTPDSLFCTPEGYSFQSCDDSCQLNFVSTVIPGTKKYSERLTAKAFGLNSHLKGKVIHPKYYEK